VEEEEKDTGPLTLSRMGKDIAKPLNLNIALVEGTRILSGETRDAFSDMNYDKMLSLATKNQLVHVCTEPTVIDFS